MTSPSPLNRNPNNPQVFRTGLGHTRLMAKYKRWATSMHTFTLTTRPDNLIAHRKTSKVFLSWQTEPFQVEVQDQAEPMLISPEQTDDWQGGYYIAYPDDGSKPYPIAKSFVDKNYEPVET